MTATPVRSSRREGHLVWVVVLLASLLAPPAGAYPASEVEFEGHGWGHGRGMGQWGALGYAIDHGWGYRKILGHFYGGTHENTIADRRIDVRLTRFDGEHTLIQQERGEARTNAASGTFDALRAVRTGSDTFRVDEAPHCGGPWTTIRESMSGPVVFWPTHQNNDRRDMLQVCEPSGARRWVRGNILSLDADATTSSQTTEVSPSHVVGPQRTVNRLQLELYLRGVVPRESPASWGDLDGGAGMHQLRAQAVAARSYAASENRYAYADTCDTTACQVYGGVAVQVGSDFTHLEHANTTKAVKDTKGQVRKFSSGNIARTEFSASTGGWSAGGTFPAVRDHGDDICSAACNPHHDWTHAVPVSDVESAWPRIGTLRSIEVTERNGHGDFGGRALTVRIEGSDGTVTPSGNRVRFELGLRSNWFRILSPDDCTITGTDGPDELVGTAGPDVICGLGGDDILRGRGGEDHLKGGPGDDRLVGGPDDDLMAGHSGSDTLRGGAGEDRGFGGPHDDLLIGGPGADALGGGGGGDTVRGSRGDDHLKGSTGDDILAGQGGDDLLAGHSGADRLFGHWGADRLFGGPGPDVLVGGPGPDVPAGGGGNDHLEGRRGQDRLVGGAGNDELRGQGHFDRFRGGPGTDACDDRRGEPAVSCERRL